VHAAGDSSGQPSLRGAVAEAPGSGGEGESIHGVRTGTGGEGKAGGMF
jgi:hypothetical protein